MNKGFTLQLAPNVERGRDAVGHDKRSYKSGLKYKHPAEKYYKGQNRGELLPPDDA